MALLREGSGAKFHGISERRLLRNTQGITVNGAKAKHPGNSVSNWISFGLKEERDGLEGNHMMDIAKPKKRVPIQKGISLRFVDFPEAEVEES
jgi:hypothetical protein